MLRTHEVLICYVFYYVNVINVGCVDDWARVSGPSWKRLNVCWRPDSLTDTALGG